LVVIAYTILPDVVSSILFAVAVAVGNPVLDDQVELMTVEGLSVYLWEAAVLVLPVLYPNEACRRPVEENSKSVQLPSAPLGVIAVNVFPPLVERRRPLLLAPIYRLPAPSHPTLKICVSDEVLLKCVQVFPWSEDFHTPIPKTASVLFVGSPVEKYKILAFVGSWQIDDTDMLRKLSFTEIQLGSVERKLVHFHTPPATPPHHTVFPVASEASIITPRILPDVYVPGAPALLAPRPFPLPGPTLS
jgi:hypothetical protein